ncbi:MAG: PCRF domain-containing protein [Deltaproteobacteria bacterium]|nr:PCRF domain-containing protein [Deltaproteobacteria bacterium]
MILGWDGLWDAIVELSPIGARGRAARDLLISKYTAWAESQRMTVVILREPKEDNEPGMIAVKGPYAAGLLRLEAGLHRVRDAEGLSAVARVRVAPWTDERAGSPGEGAQGAEGRRPAGRQSSAPGWR